MNKAFTLSETLITLGIIGVVAALTMPAVITNYQKKQTSAQLKKAYSTFAQAWFKRNMNLEMLLVGRLLSHRALMKII